MQENLEKQQDSLIPVAPETNSWNSGLLEAGTETSTTDEDSVPIDDQKKWCTGLFCLDPEIHVPKRSICLGALTGLSALGVPIYLGTAAAPITSLCLGNFSSAIKGLVPKSENNKAKQIAIMVAMASCGAGLDFTSTFLGFPTNFAFSGLCGAAATATLKKGMKAFLYDDITAQKERFRLEKEQAKAWIENELTWLDVYSKKPVDYLEAIARGETPKWDSDKGGYVYENTSQETTTIGGKKSAEKVEEVDPQADAEVDTELPF